MKGFVACGIYKIESKITGRMYIGSSCDIARRWRVHISELKRNVHHSIILQRHINKVGINDLCFSIIEECEKKCLIEREQYYIDTLMPYYNIRRIAESNIGIRRSEETKEKLRKINLGKKQSEEMKRKASIRMIGNAYTKGITPVNAKKVICTKTGIIFKNVEEAAKSIGMKRTTLGEQLRGKNRNKTTFKYL